MMELKTMGYLKLGIWYFGNSTAKIGDFVEKAASTVIALSVLYMETIPNCLHLVA